MITNHKDLKVWQRSINFVKEIYKLSNNFPDREIFGLTSQMRRAAVSIPSNIAEGAARNGKTEFIRFLYISLGSLAETETQLIIANELNYLSNETYNEISDELIIIRKMLLSLIKSLKTKTHHSSRITDNQKKEK